MCCEGLQFRPMMNSKRGLDWSVGAGSWQALKVVLIRIGMRSPNMVVSNERLSVGNGT